jgi:hypothetical protein
MITMMLLALLVKAEEVTEMERLLDAIAEVESGGNCRAVGDGGLAIGPYQIHKAYWRDGTRLLKVQWPYKEAQDPIKGRQVVNAYLWHYGRGKGIEVMARIHNGGPNGDRKAATKAYWQKIRKVLK